MNRIITLILILSFLSCKKEKENIIPELGKLSIEYSTVELRNNLANDSFYVKVHMEGFKWAKIISLELPKYMKGSFSNETHTESFGAMIQLYPRLTDVGSHTAKLIIETDKGKKSFEVNIMIGELRNSHAALYTYRNLIYDTWTRHDIDVNTFRYDHDIQRVYFGSFPIKIRGSDNYEIIYYEKFYAEIILEIDFNTREIVIDKTEIMAEYIEWGNPSILGKYYVVGNGYIEPYSSTIVIEYDVFDSNQKLITNRRIIGKINLDNWSGYLYP